MAPLVADYGSRLWYLTDAYVVQYNINTQQNLGTQSIGLAGATLLSEFRETGGCFCGNKRCLFPHYCHKKLIQIGEVKKIVAACDLTAGPRDPFVQFLDFNYEEKRNYT